METAGHTYVLKIEGVKGECSLQNKDLKDQVLLDSWSLSYSFPTETSDASYSEGMNNRGKVLQTPVTIAKKLNSGGLALLQNIWQGKRIDEVTIYAVNNNDIYLTSTFNNVLIKNVSIHALGEAPQMTLSFAYSKVAYSFRPAITVTNPAPGNIPVSHDFAASHA